MTTPLSAQSIIPYPSVIENGAGTFEMPSQVSVYAEPEVAGSLEIIDATLDFALQSNVVVAPSQAGATIRILHDPTLGAESYRLQVGASGVAIYSSSDAGAFYAAQTLRQLLPVDTDSNERIALPVLQIVDEPRFGWRGMHMDVSRHFASAEDVKRFIDTIAMYKFNRFHWHLTDDQGWRIEIKQYPKLTEVGGCRAQSRIGKFHMFGGDPKFDGKPHCGFYTQEQIADIVEYAGERHITVIPEIEFPGHSQAAIAAYPVLGNTGTQIEVREDWGVSKHVLNPSDATIEFYKNVLTEVMALFPSQHIHIGGDEAPTDEWKESAAVKKFMEDKGFSEYWEVQAWMVNELNAYIENNDRTMVGWDEILTSKLDKDAVVMAWRSTDFGEEAAVAGHNVVMTPFRDTYFDAYQGDPDTEPPAIYPSYTTLAKVYAFEPVPDGLSEDQARKILGAQGQLWREVIPTFAHLEYMAFPRAIALSEVLWTSDKPGFEHFSKRVQSHQVRLDKLGVNYRALGNDGLSPESEKVLGRWNRVTSLYLWMSHNDLMNYKGAILVLLALLLPLIFIVWLLVKIGRKLWQRRRSNNAPAADLAASAG